MKEPNSLENQRSELIERYRKQQESMSREERIQQMVGENPTEEAVRAANQHLDEAEAMIKAGWNPKGRPTQEEIDNFVITPEQWQEALRFYHERKNDLITAAAFNRENAYSWRNFKVGCAVAGMGPRTPDGEYVVWQGYNVKPAPGPTEGEDKRCAERNELDAAQTELKAVFAITTVSKEADTGGEEMKSHGVLHPCKECRLMFRDLLKKGFLKDDTMLLSVNDADPKNLKAQEMTMKELLELYKDDK
jgi:cytidine deaminase